MRLDSFQSRNISNKENEAVMIERARCNAAARSAITTAAGFNVFGIMPICLLPLLS
jgi:hypothetical protein